MEGEGEHYEPEDDDLRLEIVLYMLEFFLQCIRTSSSQLNSKSLTYLRIPPLYDSPLAFEYLFLEVVVSYFKPFGKGFNGM